MSLRLLCLVETKLLFVLLPHVQLPCLWHQSCHVHILYCQKSLLIFSGTSTSPLGSSSGLTTEGAGPAIGGGHVLGVPESDGARPPSKENISNVALPEAAVLCAASKSRVLQSFHLCIHHLLSPFAFYLAGMTLVITLYSCTLSCLF